MNEQYLLVLFVVLDRQCAVEAGKEFPNQHQQRAGK